MQSQKWGITEPQGRTLFEFILRERPVAILELGAGIGTSACYMAAALEQLGRGKILSIDRNPDLPEWVDRTFAKLDSGLGRFHELLLTPRSYNDELMKMILENTRGHRCNPCFDFVFIDGAHLWDVDACAFFLAEKLLKPRGWMLFDDLTWTVAGSPEAIKNGVGPGMTDDMLNTQQVMRVFELCVLQHSGFESFMITDDWGWARKKPADGTSPTPVEFLRLSTDTGGARSKVRQVLRRLTS